MSLPRIGAKMSANAAPTQAPAQRPAASDDQDPVVLSADDHEVLLLSGYDQELSIEEPDGDPIDEKGVEGCIDEGCIADECADAGLVEPVCVGEYGSRDEYSGAVGIMWVLSALKRDPFRSRHD